MMVCLLQLSCNRGGLPMFELVDSQPSHMVSVDALNLTPGEWTAYSLLNIFQKIQFMKMNFNGFFFPLFTCWRSLHRFLGLGQVGAVLWFRRWRVWDPFPVRNKDNALLFSTVGREILGLFSVSEGKPEGMNINWRPLEPVQLQWCSQCVSHSVLLNSHWMLSVSNIETAWWKP